MKNKIFVILILVLFFFSYLRVFADETCSSSGYSVFTVNGILNDEIDAIKNKDKLKSRFATTYNNEPLIVDYLYNPTHLAGIGDAIDAVEQGLFNQESDYDLVEMLNDASQKVTTQKLLLVGHSQGNFYANNFYDKTASQSGGVPKESMGVYGVATPANRVAGEGKYLTSDTDNVINSVIAKVIKILSPNIHIPLQNGDGNGHSFSDVYLKYQGDKIISDIKSSLDKLQNNDEQVPQDPCISPPELTTFHKIQSVAFTSADFVINNTSKAGVYIADGAYNIGATIGSVIHDVGLVVNNTISGLLANAIDSLPDPSSITTIPVDVSEPEKENSSQEKIPVTADEKTATVEPASESNKKENETNNIPQPIIPGVVSHGGNGGGNSEIVNEEISPIVDTTAPLITTTIDENTTLASGEYNYDNLIITNNAILTLEGDPLSLDSFKGVKINAVNLTVTEGASISADQKGYDSGQGPGAVEALSASSPGASYGGLSYNNPNDATYGSAIEPIDLGSGGASSNNGGGAIRIVVSDTFTNNGIVSSDGGYSSSGGSIYVTTNNLVGSGIFRANGGQLYQFGYFKSPGGGGRIAVYYQTSSFGGIAEVKGGCGNYGNGYICSNNGTVGFFDTLNNNLTINNSWLFQKNDSPFNFNHITFTDDAEVTSEDDVNITANDILMDKNSSFTLGNNQILNIPTITIDENSTLTFSGSETITTDTFNLKGNSILTILPEQILSLTIPNINIDLGSSISANKKGYIEGPGAPLENSLAGASYGGVGFNNILTSTYGDDTEPIDFGSGGRVGNFRGGGAIRLISTGTLVNNGTISANGDLVSSGGSIYITANDISGSGNFSTNGGGMYVGAVFYGPGGGGRLAIHYKTFSFSGIKEALGRCGNYGNGAVCSEDGTVKMINASFSSLKTITTFNFGSLIPEVVGVVDEVNHTIVLTVPFGTDVTTLVPNILISLGASINPSADVVQDFTNPVTYTVTAENSSTQDYIVTVTVSPDPNLPPTPDLDTTPPVISALSISPSPIFGYAKIGDTITLSITADSTGYTAQTVNVNNVATTDFIDNGNGTYTANYIVSSGDSDITSGTIPASVILSDASGNFNVAYTTVIPNNLKIDANEPTLVSAEVTTVTTIDVVFSEDIDGNTVNTTGNEFTVSGHTVSSAEELVDGIITLTLSTAIGTGETPNVTFTSTNFKDLAGNQAINPTAVILINNLP
ncbi:hypothetical protein A3B84_01740 [Candidatus Nomurabacteria bacterium RIFCSPHIGHO2_02_FULL_35_13]|uniref:DUF5018 domain-containing protein n=1 Tax=Candidatus Nomurabacteria bacterium RIFCSPHIGHO2_02_FULL_35_13 TaxID=1801748 RepID=A0A1F6VPB2_9BACT|nr:MAG: hypothetical protein A3B84_01740 [Candidatus Nomurabacteria bacterium RIFCSPHIGHO2_02_FULL_35_13]